MKVIEKLRGAKDQVTFSFEYFPPRTDEGVDNLFERMDRMVALQPLFCDITWGAGGSTADLTLDIAIKMQNMICVESMMHLTCTNMPVDKIDRALEGIKENGIQNVLALRGDPPQGQDRFVQVEGGFSCALDLVRHIRSHYEDYFGITVAGYPEAHPDVINSDAGATEDAYKNDLLYLKQKVDAGADVIITQLFYDTDLFLKFYNDCRQIGITCPIIPGIMPINNYKGFKRMTGFCKTKIPSHIIDALEPIKDDDKAVSAYGIHLGTEMCKKILAHGIKNLHLYTLNMEKSAIGILQNLGLVDISKIKRSLPWRPPANLHRAKEDVRPIFWSNRPRSYISRTTTWEEFPHGKWGDMLGFAFCVPLRLGMAPMQVKLRKVIGAFKDQTSISLAKVSSTSDPDIDVAVLKATSREEVPIEERYVQEILSLTDSSRFTVSTCVDALARRLNKTHDWIVAIKILMLAHRLLCDGNPTFVQELSVSGRRGMCVLSACDFRDESHSNGWDFSAFVRSYSLYLDERLDASFGSIATRVKSDRRAPFKYLSSDREFCTHVLEWEFESGSSSEC